MSHDIQNDIVSVGDQSLCDLQTGHLDKRASTRALPFPRHGPNQGNDCLMGSERDSNALKTATLDQSFPRHGPDQRNDCLIGTDQNSDTLKAACLALSFPRHGPDQATNCLKGTDHD